MRVSNSSQFEDLKLHAMNTSTRVVNYIIEGYQELDFHRRLIICL